jgi:hypothetical protein
MLGFVGDIVCPRAFPLISSQMLLSIVFPHRLNAPCSVCRCPSLRASNLLGLLLQLLDLVLGALAALVSVRLDLFNALATVPSHTQQTANLSRRIRVGETYSALAVRRELLLPVALSFLLLLQLLVLLLLDLVCAAFAVCYASAMLSLYP